MKKKHLAVVAIFILALLLTFGWLSTNTVGVSESVSTCDYSTPQGLEPRHVWEKNIYTVNESPSVNALDKVTVKFVEGSLVRVRGGELVSLCGADLRPFNKVLNKYNATIDGIQYYTSEKEKWNDDSKRTGEQNTGKQLADMNLYYTVSIDDNTDYRVTRKLVDDLFALTIVEAAYANPVAVPMGIPSLE